MTRALSRWCAAGTIEVDVLREDFKTWDTTPMSGHKRCHGERWHDEYHGKDPGCCAGPEERESWACECGCHAEGGGDAEFTDEAQEWAELTLPAALETWPNE